MDPKGKVALVTGASRGIGKAVAMALAAKGASLFLVARNETDLASTAKTCRAVGSPRVETLATDLSTYNGLDATIMGVVRAFDGFDILINNAGVGTARPMVDVDDKEFDHDMALNLRAPYMLTQAAIKTMRRRGGGQVVQVASGLAYFSRAGWSLYAAAKFGLRGFTECVRQEVSQEGIKIGIVAPGLTETHFFDAWQKPPAFEQALHAADVVHAVMAMVEQSERSDIREIMVRGPLSP